jgi:hypothetical protein
MRPMPVAGVMDFSSSPTHGVSIRNSLCCALAFGSFERCRRLDQHLLSLVESLSLLITRLFPGFSYGYLKAME